MSFQDKVYFAADDGVSGLELWESDGTAAGTALVADIAAPGGSDPIWLTTAGNQLYFNAFDEEHGRELWLVAPRVTPPWQNPQDPMDIDASGLVTIADIWTIVGDMRANSVPRILPDPPSTPPPPYVDCNGDGWATLADLLVLVVYYRDQFFAAGEGEPDETSLAENWQLGAAATNNSLKPVDLLPFVGIENLSLPISGNKLLEQPREMDDEPLPVSPSFTRAIVSIGPQVDRSALPRPGISAATFDSDVDVLDLGSVVFETVLREVAADVHRAWTTSSTSGRSQVRTSQG